MGNRYKEIFIKKISREIICSDEIYIVNNTGYVISILVKCNGDDVEIFLF